jgi:hypothetical protein
VSANIKDQLDSLRAQSIAAHQSFVDMRLLLEQAKPVADSLALMNTELHEYNATLQLTINLGFTNLTGDLAQQRAATKHLGLTLDTGTVSRGEYISTTDYQFSHIQLVLAPPGHWILLGSINVNNAACQQDPVAKGCTDALCSAVTTDPNGPLGHYDQCTSVTRNPTGWAACTPNSHRHVCECTERREALLVPQRRNRCTRKRTNDRTISAAVHRVREWLHCGCIRGCAALRSDGFSSSSPFPLIATFPFC